MTRVRDRLPYEVHGAVFRLVLAISDEKHLLRQDRGLDFRTYIPDEAFSQASLDEQDDTSLSGDDGIAAEQLAQIDAAARLAGF